MKVIMETISGKKGIKHFADMNEYVDFMTKNGHKIKAIKESEMPYDDKPVKLPKVSTSNGWEQLDSSAFGDIMKNAEKGEQILPKKQQSAFKDSAEFEPSKSSEKEDKAEEPKVEKSPVKNEGGSDKGFKEFKYEEPKKEDKAEEPKEDSEPKEEKSEEKDEDKKEKVTEGIKDYLPRAGFIRNDDEDKASQKMGVWGGQGTDDQLRKAKIIAKVKFANGQRMGGVSKEDLEHFDEYYAQYKEIYDEDLNEGFFNKGLQGEQLDEYISEYFIYVYMYIYGMIEDLNSNQTYVRIVKELTNTEKSFKKVVNIVDETIANLKQRRIPADTIMDTLNRILARKGVDEKILSKAVQMFKSEELNEGCKKEAIEKPSMDDVHYDDDLSDADREMYDSEVNHILDIWDTLSPEEQQQVKKLIFTKQPEKETLTEKDEDFEEYENCSWCGEKFPKGSMRKEKDMGYICHQCGKGIESREGDLDWEELDEGTHYESAVNPWGQYQFIISNEEKGSDLAIKAQEIYRDMEDGAIDEATAKQRLGNIAALVQNKLWGK